MFILNSNILSRRTDLNTIRKEFCWSSEWTHILSHVQTLWIDNKTCDYFVGIFYCLKIPSSHYIIRRLFTQLVIIQADLLLFRFKRFVGFIHIKKYLFFLLYKVKKWLKYKNKYKIRRWFRWKLQSFRMRRKARAVWRRSKKKNRNISTSKYLRLGRSRHLFTKHYKWGRYNSFRAQFLRRKSVLMRRILKSTHPIRVSYCKSKEPLRKRSAVLDNVVSGRVFGSLFRINKLKKRRYTEFRKAARLCRYTLKRRLRRFGRINIYMRNIKYLAYNKYSTYKLYLNRVRTKRNKKKRLYMRFRYLSGLRALSVMRRRFNKKAIHICKSVRKHTFRRYKRYMTYLYNHIGIRFGVHSGSYVVKKHWYNSKTLTKYWAYRFRRCRSYRFFFLRSRRKKRRNKKIRALLNILLSFIFATKYYNYANFKRRYLLSFAPSLSHLHRNNVFHNMVFFQKLLAKQYRTFVRLKYMLMFRNNCFFLNRKLGYFTHICRTYWCS